MSDESPREVRPVESLRREVEPPRAGAGLWMPMMALASAAMLTIVSGVAVMTRPPRPVLVAPAAEAVTPVAPSEVLEAEPRDRDRLRREVHRALDDHKRYVEEHFDEVHVPCKAPVYRGDLDGQGQPFEECITYRRK